MFTFTDFFNTDCVLTRVVG